MILGLLPGCSLLWPDVVFPTGDMNEVWLQLSEAQAEREGRPSRDKIHVLLWPDGKDRRRPKDPRQAQSPVSSRMLRVFRGHTDDIHSLAYTHDGRFVISGGDDRSFRVWDLATGEPITVVGTEQYSTDCVNAVSMGPEGRYLARAETINAAVHDLGSVGRKEDGRMRHFYGAHDSSSVTDVEFSPDSRFLVSCGVDWTIRVWELSTGVGVGVFRGHTGQVSAIAYAPDGRTILSGGVDTTLKLWDVATGECLRTFEGHAGPVWSVAVSPDGNYGLSGGDGCKLWDLRTGRCLRIFGGDAVVGSVDFSPDGRFILTGSLDKTVTLWNTQTGARLQTFSTHDRVTKVALSPDGRTALSDGVQDAFVLWDLVDIEGYYDQAQFDELARITECRRLMAEGRFDQAETLAANLDERVAPQATMDQLRRDSRAERIYQEAAKKLRDLSHRRQFTDAEALYRQVRPDVFFRHEMALRLIIDSCRIEELAIPGNPEVKNVQFTDDLKFAAAIHKDRTIEVWSVSDWTRLGSFRGGEDATSAQVSSDGRRVLTISKKALGVWDVQRGELIWEHRRTLRRFFSEFAVSYNPPPARFSSNGEYVIGKTKDTVMLWDAATGRRIGVFKGHRWYMGKGDVSSDGRWVLTSSADGTIHLRATDTGSLHWARAQKSGLSDVKFSADGKRVLVADGARLEVVDLHSGRRIQALWGPSTTGYLACDEVDQRYVVTSAAGVMNLFDLKTNRCVWSCDVAERVPPPYWASVNSGLVKGVTSRRLITTSRGRLWSIDLTGLMTSENPTGGDLPDSPRPIRRPPF